MVEAVSGIVDVVYSLIRATVRCFDDAGVNVVNVMVVEGAWFIDVLRLNGFLDSRVRLNVFLDPLGEAERVRELVDVESGRGLVLCMRLI